MSTIAPGIIILDRMVKAVEIVKERLLRATGALENEQIPYAVIGGNAVGAWVAEIDLSAVRNTQDVDLLIDRNDLPRVIETLERVGFRYRKAAGIHMLLDGPDARARDAVHLIFADERVRPDYVSVAPSVDEVRIEKPFRFLTLDALVRMKLTSFRDKDRTHIRDLIGVGLVDHSWLQRLMPELAVRLKEILDAPDG